MALRSLSYALFVAFSVKIVDNQCTDTSSNVSLDLLSEGSTCPSVPVTAQCCVKQPIDPVDLLLSWQCTGLDGMPKERLVLCDDGRVSKLICQFGEVYDIMGVCTSVGNETVITSEATFNTTTLCDMLLFCSYGGDEKQHISVTIQDLKPPSLFMNSDNEENELPYKVTVVWSEDNCTPQEVEYLLCVNSSLSNTSMIYRTNLTNMTLYLHEAADYTVIVTAQLCAGNVTSDPSNPLYLKFSGTPVHTPKDSSNAEIIGGSVAAVGAVVIALIGIGVLPIYMWHRNRRQNDQHDEVDLPVRTIKYGSSKKIHDCLIGEDIPLDEQNKFAKISNNTDVTKRTGIGGLCIDEKYIYYSYKCTTGENKIFLRICEHDFEHDKIKFIYDIPLPYFVRGIGKDNGGFLYVLCCDTTDSHVLKFDSTFTPVRRTCKNAAEHFGEPYGMLVTSEYVLVCARAKKKICILDKELNFHRFIKCNDAPIGIAKIEDKYFFTTEAAICIIDQHDIDKVKERVKVENFECMMTENGGTEPFKSQIELRGICANEKYLYVTERDTSVGGRVLCLEYHEGQLNLKSVYENTCQECTPPKRCCPIVIAHHNGTIIYSQGGWDRKFHLQKIICNETESKTMIDEM